MSHFVETQSRIKDRDALVAALVELGWPREQIELHDAPVALYGYQGDERPERAEVVIRRAHVGSLSNDVGFARQADGSYAAIISEYDRQARGLDTAWLGRLTQAYAVALIRRQCAQRRIPVVQERQGDRWLLRLRPAELRAGRGGQS